MNGPLLDFPSYVAKTEPIRQQHAATQIMEEVDNGLMITAEDVLEEIRYIIDTWPDRSEEENREALREQARRLLG
ncbi:hypothetical protein G3578_07590 [Brevibacillus sp. SYP-B805]|uniref:hypothetical protein n=1 Tax=Brevibacillus sp. SYP-B805 TaxID=1578199 RepID=UPI0013EB3D41|nr:hypothetical protein [Brevibacillus sp. SYP-B805]NGQ95046.1 hypothetical protein [Brevibacillus sp. SYP-B805]